MPIGKFEILGAASPFVRVSAATRASQDSLRADDLLADEEFLTKDRQLDAARTGPLWLGNPRVADMVVDALRFSERELKLYALSAFVVMPNHMHVLWKPEYAVEVITRRLKGYTSLQANRILGRVGQRFWQAESFDHWIRTDGEFD